MNEPKNKGGRPKGSGEKYNVLNIRMSDENKEKLKRYARQQKITVTEAIERFIQGLDVEPEPEENP